MASKLKLQEELVKVLNNDNVYLQPPESIKLTYPCAKIELEDIDSVKADNTVYMMNRRYSIMYITRDIMDDPTERILTAFSFASFDRTYKADNLYHYVYSIYY